MPAPPKLLARHHTSRAMRVLCYAASSGLLFGCGADNQVVAWAVTTAPAVHGGAVRVAERGRLVRHRGIVCDVCAAPPAGVVVSGGMDGTVRVWDAASFAQLAVHSDHTGGVRCVVYQPSADLVLTASFDLTIVGRDLSQNLGAPVFRLTGHKFPIVTLASIEREHYALSVDDGGVLRWWNVRRSSGIVSAWTGGGGRGRYVGTAEPDLTARAARRVCVCVRVCVRVCGGLARRDATAESPRHICTPPLCSEPSRSLNARAARHATTLLRGSTSHN